ncbi:MAG: topoisomerase protein [Parcubacteria group bacterium GW2011_GWA2_38_13]|nr:MAG: topoisomerase protein [Parcubacteria group bacterium GW2011_GWA2_38_13]
MKNLVIVESPTKAKTITKFLGKDYKVESSFGHVRDLPKTKLGVDIENNFEPTYTVPLKAKKVVETLKKDAEKAKIIYFATDEDREGEAISWHLIQLIKPKKNQIKRIAFHEITEEAIKEAIQNPRDLDMNLVNAQQARRVLDRLVGYKLSPLLWHKVARGLSAGRVQSVAVRLIVERERQIQAFKPEEYWTIDAIFAKTGSEFHAHIISYENKPIEKFTINTKDFAEKIKNRLENEKFFISSVEKKQAKRNPSAPYTTSTLQQAANNRLGFSAKQTMMLAQQLYEGVELGEIGQVGLITYMRTDSTNLSEKFIISAGSYIAKNFGQNYYQGPKTYKTKARNSQEAHEAIRPTHAHLSPEEIKQYLNPNQLKLYDLVWKRAMASQMTEAVVDTTSVDITDTSKVSIFRATGSIIAFDGFLKLYPSAMEENILPEIQEKDNVDVKTITSNQHFTEPPARYTEATLVKALEKRSIGRPSTYAPTISTVQERGYVLKEDRRLKPTDMGILVNDVLVEHFPHIVDYDFTANLESELDDIAEGKLEWQKAIEKFYTPFNKNLAIKEKELVKKEITEEKTDEVCEKCGKPMVIKMGRYGKFMACSGYPECKNTKEVGADGVAIPAEKIEEKCPECGKDLTRKRGRFGFFIGCSGYPECKYIKKTPPKEYAVCPKCNKGKIVAKRSRRGVFYACSNYPECKNAYWAAPTGEKCTECQSLMLFGKNESVVCSNKECKNHKKP